MRDAVLGYLVRVIASNKIEAPVVDFGGTIIPVQQAQYGGTVRHLFKDYDYKTFDLSGADITGDIYDTKLTDSSIGTALCLETLEHLAEPKQAIAELFRVLKPGGLIVITTLLNWEIHRFPKDYWRFLPDGLEHVLLGFEKVNITTEYAEKFPTWSIPTGIFATARKPKQ